MPTPREAALRSLLRVMRLKPIVNAPEVSMPRYDIKKFYKRLEDKQLLKESYAIEDPYSLYHIEVIPPKGARKVGLFDTPTGGYDTKEEAAVMAKRIGDKLGVETQLIPGGHGRNAQGEPFSYEIIYGDPAYFEPFNRAWSTGDSNTVGKLLGYDKKQTDRLYPRKRALKNVLGTEE
jgi:hypothetical protein